jgi:hypothetical protein
MKQTKKQSLVESLTNTAVGALINLGFSFLIFPVVGIASSGGQNAIVVAFFTIISIVRGFVIRRYFNKKG